MQWDLCHLFILKQQNKATKNVYEKIIKSWSIDQGHLPPLSSKKSLMNTAAMLSPGWQWKKPHPREIKSKKCWTTAREARGELWTFTTSERTKSFKKPLGGMTDGHTKGPRPNQQICNWWPCPAWLRRTHRPRQDQKTHLWTPSSPTARLSSEPPPMCRCTSLALPRRNLAALGQKDVLFSRPLRTSQETSASDLPLGTLMHRDDLSHMHWRQRSTLTVPELQAKQR